MYAEGRHQGSAAYGGQSAPGSPEGAAMVLIGPVVIVAALMVIAVPRIQRQM